MNPSRDPSLRMDQAQPPSAVAMQEASQRFRVLVAWLRVVMHAESHGNANSVSEQGAIGLTPLMLATYEEMRMKHGLGPDPFDPRDNILASAAYLAEMFVCYGSTGFLAAYNAGHRRYEKHLRGWPPPSETTNYVVRFAPRLGLERLPVAPGTASIP